jgi:hypothetical protein
VAFLNKHNGLCITTLRYKPDDDHTSSSADLNRALNSSLVLKPRQFALDELADGRNAQATIQFFSPASGFDESANLFLALLPDS